MEDFFSVVKFVKFLEKYLEIIKCYRIYKGKDVKREK